MPLARYIVSNMSLTSVRSSSVISVDRRRVLAQDRIAEDADVENAHSAGDARLTVLPVRAVDARDAPALDDEARFAGLDRDAVVEALRRCRPCAISLMWMTSPTMPPAVTISSPRLSALSERLMLLPLLLLRPDHDEVDDGDDENELDENGRSASSTARGGAAWARRSAAGIPMATWSCGWYRSRVVAREPVAAPRVDRSGADRVARVAHQADEEMYIVQGEQAQAEHLVGDVEVADVGAGESAARGALALVVERPRVGAELGALDVEAAVAREDGAVAAHARRCDAVEEIDAAEHALDEVLGKADAHEVARAVARELGVDDLEDAVHVGLGFADGESADAVADPVAGVADGAGGVAAEGRRGCRPGRWERGLGDGMVRGAGKWCRGEAGNCVIVVVGGGPPARNRSSAATHRANHRMLRSLASRAAASSLCPGMT